MIALLLAGCSTIDAGGPQGEDGGGGTSGSNSWEDTGADDTHGGFPGAPEDFDYCLPGPEGTESFLGWQIACNASSSSRRFVNPTDSTYVEIEDVSGYFGSICCGGISPVAEADADCQVLCIEHVCEAARVQHVAWALDVSNDGMGGDCLDSTANCGFDFEQCITGMSHEQVAQPGNLFSYFLVAECEAVHDQDLSPWGSQGDFWEWVEFPNDPNNDPVPLCAPAPEPGPGLPEGGPEMEVEEQPGTSVTLHWAVVGGPSGVEQSLEPEVGLAYAINPCPAGDCISLSRLDVTLPNGLYQGVSLKNLHLILEEPTAEVPLSSNGRFTLSSGAVRASASFIVEGIPLIVTGHNTGRVSGVASPHTDTMALTNLAFGFDDGLMNATLEINLNGFHTQRAPEAAITVLDAPVDCTAPVTFEAAATDPDGDALTHVWWVPPWFLGTGTLLEAPLTPGTHGVYLTSIDASGRSDSTALQYVRSCR